MAFSNEEFGYLEPGISLVPEPDSPDNMHALSAAAVTRLAAVRRCPLALHHRRLAAILRVPHFTHRMVERFGTYHTLIWNVANQRITFI